MKPYYQALLQIDFCIPLTSHMPSQEPMSYYELLLKGIKAEPGMNDRHYLALRNEARGKQHKLQVPLPEPEPTLEGGDEEVILAIDYEPPPKRARVDTGTGRRNRAAAKPAPPLRIPDVPPLPGPSRPPSVVVEPVPPDPPVPPVVEPPGVGGSSGSGGIAAPEEEPVILGEPDEEDHPHIREKYDFKPGIGGAGIICMTYFDKKRQATYANWILRCPRHGSSCLKKKIINAKSTARFGDIEPVAYVHAWIALEALPGHTHSFTNPTNVAVEEYVAAHRAELEEIVAKYLVHA